MSRDSVAVVISLRRICGHDSRSIEGCLTCEAADRIEADARTIAHMRRQSVASADRIAALTREAAPQASGGDGLLADELDKLREDFPVGAPSWALLLWSANALRRLATTDSAIQSQQGATGGAVDCLALRPWSDFWASRGRTDVSHDFATFRLAEEWATACITAAHPQAAGSAPVGDDTARLDYIERTFSGMTNRERYLPVQMIWGKGCNGRTLREACDKYMKRDAALEKERAE